MKFFEKFAALVFLFLMLGLVAFLTYVPMPLSSEKVILIIIGGLMAEAAKGVGKLVGGEDAEKIAQRSRIDKLETELTQLRAEYRQLYEIHMRVTDTLLQHHVIHDQTRDAAHA